MQELSFFVCQQMLTNYMEEVILFRCETAEERLKQAEEFCSEKSELQCKCGQKLGSFTNNERLNIFGGNSVKGVFVNRYGVSFNVMTTRVLEHYARVTPPSEEDTWFPGYTWQIIVCENCSHHLGWLFSTSRNMDMNSGVDLDLHPRRFFGVPLSAVIVN